ncbi:unnamed protein product, partial [Tenebrio molitor]
VSAPKPIFVYGPTIVERCGVRLARAGEVIELYRCASSRRSQSTRPTDFFAAFENFVLLKIIP